MKKLLELKSLDTEVRELLRAVETPAGVHLCVHLHYLHPTISIYRSNLDAESIPTTNLMQSDVVFTVDTDIDEQIVDEIIAQIEKVLQ
jgi:hypothetical protein